MKLLPAHYTIIGIFIGGFMFAAWGFGGPLIGRPQGCLTGHNIDAAIAANFLKEETP